MNKGFSLIEILVTSLIVGIIGMGSVFVVVNSQRLSIESTRKAMLISNVNRLMVDIGRDVKSGAIMDSDGSSLKIINFKKELIVWDVGETYIQRISGDGIRDFIFFGTDDVDISNFGSVFVASLTGEFYKVDISLNITHTDVSGSLTIPTITNRFYCRTNPQGCVW